MKSNHLLLAGGAILLLCTTFCGGCSAGRRIPVMMEENAVLIDVRSAEEFRSGHLPGAINIPHTEIAGKIPAAVPDPATPIYLYCRTGRRVGIAMETLKKAGYNTLYNLQGMEHAAGKLNLQPTPPAAPEK